MWVGRCKACQSWGTVSLATTPARSQLPQVAATNTAAPITSIDASRATGLSTGIGELDRVLGPGLVPGAVILLAGEPGVGKSTLLMRVASSWARAGRRTLYISAEESATQLRLRAERTGCLDENFFVAAANELAGIVGQVESVEPSLMILDSVQTVTALDIDGVPGGVTQVRQVTSVLVEIAKSRNMTVLIVGHVTKDGGIAGPRTLEHLVDVVLSFEGEQHSGFRIVRGLKNRFGPSDEIGCFQMGEAGIEEVPDPSGVFTTGVGRLVSGTCLAVSLEGRRAIPVEIQALVVPSPATQVRRVTNGVDSGRVAMLLAVLQRHARVRLHDKDVYVSTVGGARVSDPALDLAVAIAIASAALDRPTPHRMIALGEVGLSGDLRPVPGVTQRLAEASRLGIPVAVVPSAAGQPLTSLTVFQAATLVAALGTMQLQRQIAAVSCSGHEPVVSTRESGLANNIERIRLHSK